MTAESMPVSAGPRTQPGESGPTIDGHRYHPSGFFVLRTPLLAFDELLGWTNDHGRDGDPRQLRAKLAELLASPEVRESIYLASPSLHQSLRIWKADPESKKGRRAEISLTRYLQRMATRATPFGTFAGWSLGQVAGGGSRLHLPARSRYRSSTRLDMDYVVALSCALEKELQDELTFYPSPSLYEAGGRLHYIEVVALERVRTHRLVAVDITDYLCEVLDRARQGAKVAELVETLIPEDADSEDREDAAAYIADLIDSQILVTRLTPPVTGPPPLEYLIDRLSGLRGGQRAASTLVEVQAALAEMDRCPIGRNPEHYEGIRRRLTELPVDASRDRLFQVDTRNPQTGGSELAIHDGVMTAILEGVEVLYRAKGWPIETGLERFCREFAERYGNRWVPLVEALDEELGIGFGRSSSGHAEASPLLAGLVFPPVGQRKTLAADPSLEVLLGKVSQALADRSTMISLEEEDLVRIEQRGRDHARNPLPDAFQVKGSLVARSEQALDDGDFHFVFESVGGPSGARLMGRFCHTDAELCRRVTEHLAEEEALVPDAVFAEVVHLPHGRTGNVIVRPVLRGYEIPCGGASGIEPERQLPLSDLLVTVGTDSNILLRSRRLGRRVIPRLTNAHIYWQGGLGLYRFLGTLQMQGVTAGLMWNWGVLDSSLFLPRVVAGSAVLVRARWRTRTGEQRALAKAEGKEGFREVQAWRRSRNLPRFVGIPAADQELFVDFDNPLSVASFVRYLRKRPSITLQEILLTADDLVVRGPDGRFVNELTIPFVRTPAVGQVTLGRADLEATEAVPPKLQQDIPETETQRCFLPGSSWLYAKIFTGTANADGVLERVVAGVLGGQRDAPGEADEGTDVNRRCSRWFFLRYSEPTWHLRLRFWAEDGDSTHLLRLLRQAVEPEVDAGRVWRFELGTYEREMERYGGPLGIEPVERIFHHDSVAALRLIQLVRRSEDPDLRWMVTLRGIDRLLEDLGWDLEKKLGIIRRMRVAFWGEFHLKKDFRLRVDAMFRHRRQKVQTALGEVLQRQSVPAWPRFADAILDQRSEALRPWLRQLRDLDGDRRLTSPLERIVPSLLHMQVNRLLRSAGRQHEVILYDFLARVYRSRAARSSAKKRSATSGSRGRR